MKAPAAPGVSLGSAFTSPAALSAQGCWEVFYADHELPIELPATVPEARVRQLCEALGVHYRLRPAGGRH